MPSNSPTRRKHNTNKKATPCWDQLKEVHANTAQLVGGTAVTLVNMVQKTDWNLASSANIVILRQMIDVMTKDLNVLQQRVSEIHAQHANRSGAGVSFDDHFASNTYASAYDEVNSQYLLSVAPMFEQFMLSFQRAFENQNDCCNPDWVNNNVYKTISEAQSQAGQVPVAQSPVTLANPV